MMYQRNQQPNNRDNYNDDNYDSSESDSDSDADMEENAGEGEDNLLEENQNDRNEHLPNNDIDDEARPPNGILERIDYLGRNNNVANIQDDENSRGNFDLPLLGEGSGCNLNLDIPPPQVNDDSSRESMDMDYDIERPTLGNITVERNPEKIEQLERAGSNKDRRDSDEEPMNNFYESDEYCSYMGNADRVQDEINSCKCRKCTLKEPTDARCRNCDNSDCYDKMNVCFKRSRNDSHSGINISNSSKDHSDYSMKTSSSSSTAPSSGCRPPCSNNDMLNDGLNNTDDEENVNHINKNISDSENCDSNLSNSNKKSIAVNNTSASTSHNSKSHKSLDDKNCLYSDDNEMDVEERNSAEEETHLECTCYENKLDHVNGHSSKMCLDLPKTPCKKCSPKEHATTSNPEEYVENLAGPADEPGGAASVNPALVENAENNNAAGALGNRVNGRNRDHNADGENARPSKRAKLNNGSTANRNKVPRTIFHKALDAVSMTWENKHLKNILASSSYSINSSNAIQTAGSSKPSQTILTSIKANFNALGQPLWHEPLAMCAARVDSLRSHGHTEAALRLSVSVVRTMKQVQKDAQLVWHRYQSLTNTSCENSKSNTCCCNCNSLTSTSSSSSSSNNSNSNAATNSNSNASNGALCGGSSRNVNNNNSSSSSFGSHSSNSRKRPMDHSRNSGYSSSSANKEGYKMYRYDYGPSSTNSYRNYGMGHDGCKRCLEARERASYQNSFNSGFHPNRFNMGGGNGGGMQPPYFRNNNFGSMGHGASNGMYEQRFNHFGSSAYRYGNNSYPPNMPHANTCHAENCSFMHRTHNNVLGDYNMFNNSRPHCSRDYDKYMNNGHHYGMGNNSNHRCGQDLKLREMIRAPMNPRFSVPHECGNPQNNCRSCDGSNNKQNEPGTSGCINNASPNEKAESDNLPSCSKLIPNPLSTADTSSSSTSEPLAKKPCSQHTKNQCCIKNYCCKMMNEKTKCCPTFPNQSASRCHCSPGTNNSYNNYGLPSQQPPCLSNNIYFGRNMGFDLPSINHNCQQKAHDDYSGICGHHSYNASNSQPMPCSSSANSSAASAVNRGASTSKALGINVDFVRNRKPGCVSNCLDCSVGCEIEFPLDAVACIFDCLTEACIIPDAINGPDMGRLTFDSVSPAAEDGSLIPPRYQHIPVPVSNDRNETYLTLSFEVSFVH